MHAVSRAASMHPVALHCARGLCVYSVRVPVLRRILRFGRCRFCVTRPLFILESLSFSRPGPLPSERQPQGAGGPRAGWGGLKLEMTWHPGTVYPLMKTMVDPVAPVDLQRQQPDPVTGSQLSWQTATRNSFVRPPSSPKARPLRHSSHARRPVYNAKDFLVCCQFERFVCAV